MWGRMRGKGFLPCHFSIFYCGCKPLKSIHTRHFDCKVTKKRVQDKKNLVLFFMPSERIRACSLRLSKKLACPGSSPSIGGGRVLAKEQAPQAFRSIEYFYPFGDAGRLNRQVAWLSCQAKTSLRRSLPFLGKAAIDGLVGVIVVILGGDVGVDVAEEVFGGLAAC